MGIKERQERDREAVHRAILDAARELFVIEGYRNVWIEIYTHAIGGLSENDFIVAAKIDKLPVKLKG